MDDGSKPPAPAPKFIAMTLSKDEKNTLAAFATFAGSSPRRAKRYLNLYLLLKTSLRSGFTQPGVDRRVNERAIIVLLAIVTALGPADAFFDVLGPPTTDAKGQKAGSKATPDTLDTLLSAFDTPAPAENTTKARKEESPAAAAATARAVIAKLLELNKGDSVDQGEAMVEALRRYAPTVRRYSF